MSIKLGVQVGPLSVEGRKRPRNEDYVAFHEPGDPRELARSGRLYIVADGVGGAAHGERASQYAAQKVLYDFYQSSGPDLGERLQSAIRAANADLYQYAERADAPQPIGTTLVAAVLCGPELVVANVGDSRAYLIREGRIHQISRDHSLVQKLIDEEELTPEAALTFPRKNVILRSVGAEAFVDVDVFRCEARPGDTLLLCTDGLHKYFPDPTEIAHVAGEIGRASCRERVYVLV